MKETIFVTFLYVFALFAVAFATYSLDRPAQGMVPSGADLVVEFVDVNTKVYRVTDGGVVCYVAVGKLHGYTVSIDCVKTYKEVRHE